MEMWVTTSAKARGFLKNAGLRRRAVVCLPPGWWYHGVVDRDGAHQAGGGACTVLCRLGGG
jgi:hypothetical protein